jgi:hypothetical protein
MCRVQSHDDFFNWLILGVVFAATVVLYVWLFRVKARAFIAAMIRLRDRIDRSQRW